MGERKTSPKARKVVRKQPVAVTPDLDVGVLYRPYAVTGRERGAFVTVEANIASGKTELCALLARWLEQRRNRRVHVLFEPVDDPSFKVFLDRFQKDRTRWAAMFQLFALKERFQQHTLAAEMALSGWFVLQDRSIFADGCFGLAARANGHIDDYEWEVYEGIFGHMKRDIRYPDLMVFLEVPPDVCLRRASGRGREEELDTIDLDYFTQIHEQHIRLAESMSQFTRVLRVPYENFAQGRIGKLADAIDEALATPAKTFLLDWIRL